MRRYQTGIFCIIVQLALALSAPVAAQEPVIVRVAPATMNLAVGAASDVAVEVVDVTGLYGFDVQLSFDPNVVEVVDADPDKAGVQVSLGRMLDSGMAVRDSADNEAGTIHYAMTQINPSEAKSGTGNLIVIKLRGKVAGTTNLAFTSVDLARRDATAIDAAPQPGAVTVLAEPSGQQQPTTTPIPTQAPPTPVPTALSAAAQGAQAQPAATATLPATATSTAAIPPTATAQAPTDPPPTRAPEATEEGTAAPVSAAAAPAESPTAENPATLPAAAAADDVATPSPEQPALAAVDPTPTAQAVALAPGQGQSGSAAAGDEQAQAGRSPEQTLLLVGIVALVLAGLLGAVLVLVARRRTAAP